MSLQNFNLLFAPKGILANFYNQQLAPFINTANARWEWQTFANQSISQNQLPLLEFERAHIIQQLYFNSSLYFNIGFIILGK